MITDPYSVLGVPSSASDDEVKKAYRELIRKYHPDSYVNNPLSDLAEEKFKEVQEAYDQIMKERDGGYQSGYGGYQNQQSTYNHNAASQDDMQYQAAYNYINGRQYQQALNVLSRMQNRNARWYYLSALANSGVGNNVKAQEDISEAVRLEPNNFQYQSLKQRLEGGTGWYQKQSTVYGRPDFSGQDWCMKMCLLNLLCNCCCNRGMCCGTPIGYR